MYIVSYSNDWGRVPPNTLTVDSPKNLAPVVHFLESNKTPFKVFLENVQLNPSDLGWGGYHFWYPKEDSPQSQSGSTWEPLDTKPDDIPLFLVGGWSGTTAWVEDKEHWIWAEEPTFWKALSTRRLSCSPNGEEPTVWARLPEYPTPPKIGDVVK